MTIKLIGLVLIVAMSVLLGYIKTSELSVNYTNLKALIDALTMLESEIKTKNSMLYEAFSECADIDRTGLFRELAEISETDGDYSKIAATVNRKISDGNAKGALFSFAGGLKTEDTGGQLANIRNCRDRLTLIYNETGSSLEKLKKVYFMSFVLSGAAIAILFM